MNRDAIKKTIAIMKSPNRTLRFDTGEFRRVTECGTFACIGGFAIVANEPKKFTRDFCMYDEAKRILGLSSEQARKLFFSNLSSTDINYGIRRLEALLEEAE